MEKRMGNPMKTGITCWFKEYDGKSNDNWYNVLIDRCMRATAMTRLTRRQLTVDYRVLLVV